MADKRIIDLEETTLTPEKYIAVDQNSNGSNSTNKVLIGNAISVINDLLPEASEQTKGVMSIEDKTKLDSLENEMEDLRVDRDGQTHLSAGDAVRNQLADLNYDILEANAELIDARIASDGTAYNSVGSAVRGQILNLTNGVIDLADIVNTIGVSLLGCVNNGYVEDGVAYFMHDEDELFTITGIGGGGGGGGGSGNNAVLTMTNTAGWLSRIIGNGTSCSISFNWSSIEQEQPTGNGTFTLKVNNVTKVSMDVAQGDVSQNITNFLVAGTNKVRATISDAYGNTSSIIYTVQVVSLEISSTFDDSIVYSATDYISYSYTPYGNAEKTVHFIVDGIEETTAIVTTSGRQQTQQLDAMSHGSHTLLVYFTAILDGNTVSSNELYYDLIVVDSSETPTIITSDFRATTATQYQTLSIPYIVYTPNSLTSEVNLLVNDSPISTLVGVDRTEHIWSFRPDETGALTLSIESGGTKKDFTLTVGESGIDVEAETANLALYLNAYGRSNNEPSRAIWRYNDIYATLSNFNFVSDGWQIDSNGYTALRVSGNARVTIPYQVFANDFKISGKTIEIEFATRNILNYDSVIVSCYSENRGFQLTAQRAFLKSEQSEISTQYKEDEHVRISFVVEKRAENRLIYIYTNGIMSGVVQYPSDDDFSQGTPVGITIGSNYCTTDIYCIRVYDNDLTRYQILDNWIADTQDLDDMLDRYHHNDVYDEYGEIVIEKLPMDLPYMIVNAPQLPQYKGDKKTVSGTYVDPVDGSKSFTFTGCQMDVQGTSSQYYARKNYKMKFKNGFTMTQSGMQLSTYAMRSNSIPTSTFTFKADVASSEGANNVELVRLYNNVCPYDTPAQEVNPNVRQGIDGFPIVMFWNNGFETTFLGKYNFNNDKGTPEVFGFASGDESWEVLNNTSNRVLFKSADFTGSDWLNDFEGRYPEDYDNPANLSDFVGWVASTDTSAATGNALPSSVTYDGVTYTNDTAAYRSAKFKAELSDYVEMDSCVFYYLFTELFLMVDSRAKNMFPSFIGSEE